MNLATLAADYNALREKLAEVVPLRERLFQAKEWNAKTVKALQEYNRTILFVLIKLRRDDTKFRRLMGDTMFSKNQIGKLLHQESPHAKLLRGYEEFFVEIVRGVNPKLKQLRRAMNNQMKIKDGALINTREQKIRALASEIGKLLAPYQALGTMVHQERPGSTEEQEVTHPERYVNDAQTSLWVIVKMISEMEVYLIAAAGIAQAAPLAQPSTDIFTEEVKNCEHFPEAVAFAVTKGYTLQSAREAVLYRVTHDTKEARRYQLTRTAAIYFRNGRNAYVAFDDDPQENVLLARATEGYDAYRNDKAWVLPRDDPLIAGAIARAKKTGRVLNAQVETGRMQFLLDGNYSTSAAVQAIIGKEAAAANESYLLRLGYRGAQVITFTGAALWSLRLTDALVEVRVVGVVGGNYYGVNDLNIRVPLDYDGFARRVRENSEWK